VSPKIAFERCCAENEGPRSPPSRPHCAKSLGSSDSVENTKPRCTGHICALYFFAPFSQSKTQFSALPVRLSRRGRIPSAVNDLVRFTLCKVVFVRSIPLPSSSSSHRGPLWVFFGFASRGGVVRRTDGIVVQFLTFKPNVNVSWSAVPTNQLNYTQSRPSHPNTSNHAWKPHFCAKKHANLCISIALLFKEVGETEKMC